MKRRRMLCCAMLLLLCWTHATAESLHPASAIRDSNARIVDEIRSSRVDREPAAAERKRTEALARVARQASNDPEGTAYFHLLFNRSIAADEAVPILDSFLWIGAFISKHHDRASNLVITVGVNDFEMYDGSTAARLTYLAKQFRTRQRIIETMSLEDPAVAGSFDWLLEFEHAIYEIQGYASFAELNELLQRHGDIVLHVIEDHGPLPYEQIRQLGERSDSMLLPEPSQAGHP